jgi:polyhydroxyalkanoate synthesis regulator phasin
VAERRITAIIPPTNHAVQATARMERLRAANSRNLGATTPAPVAAPQEYDLPPEAAAIQRMVDASPVGVRSELGEDEPFEDVEELPQQGLVSPMAAAELQRQRIAGRFSEQPQPRKSPLEVAREHMEQTRQRIADLQAYKAYVLEDIAAKQQELQDIDATLAMLGVTQEAPSEPTN